MSEFILDVSAKLNEASKTKLIKDLESQNPTIVVKTELKGGGIKEVKEYRDELNNTANVIKTYDKNMQQVGDTLVKVKGQSEEYRKELEKQKQASEQAKEAQKKLKLEAKQAEQTRIEAQKKLKLEAKQAEQTRIEEEKKLNKVVSTNSSSYIDGQGRRITELKKFNSEGKQVGDTMTHISERANSSGKSILELGKDFVDTTAKVMKFYASTLVIQVFMTAMSEAVKTVKDFDDALTQYQKVSDLSGQSLETFSENLGKMGADVARTRTQMIEAATAWKQSGYSDADSAKLAKISEMFRNISDAEISSQESAGFIISQMKAYGNETETFAQHTIDAINNVSNNMSVSSSDVSEGLSKSAAGMSALGNSFEETTALVSAGTEIMHNQASKVSRGLVSIGNNIAKLAKTSNTFNVETKNGAKSIELINSQTGDLNSTYEVLKQVAGQWKNMTEQQKTNLGITLAGKLILARIDLIAGKVRNHIYFIKSGFLKTLVPNYYSNIICGEVNNRGMVNLI